MGVRYTICHWAINRTDSQNLLSTILDVPLQSPNKVSQFILITKEKLTKYISKVQTK